MLPLAELQQQFIAALQGDDAEFLVAIDDRAPGAQQRLQIYRNNWRSNLRNALRIAYPVVERLVGEEFFVWMADQFIDAHPSHSGNLDDYGAELPEFIRQFPAAQSLPYLADVALLEHLIDAVMAAPEIAGEDGVALPVAHLLASDYPVQRIWQINQPEWEGDASVSLEEGGVNLLIQRFARSTPAGVRFDLYIQTLTPEQFAGMKSAHNRPTANSPADNSPTDNKSTDNKSTDGA